MSHKFTRRLFLGGASVALTLPLLPSLMRGGSRVRAQDDMCRAPLRFIGFYVPNGMHMQAFTPSTTGPNYTLSPTLEPLADFKQDVLVLSGLDNQIGSREVGDHAIGTGNFMCCKKATKPEINHTTSIDQVIANALEGCTPRKSIQLGLEGGGSTGNCDSGFSCAFSRSISWAGPNTPLPKFTDPQLAFDTLFQGLSVDQSDVAAQRRRIYRQSVVDAVRAQANSLKLQLNAPDQRKLDEWLTGIRDLERQISSGMSSGALCAAPEAPNDTNSPQEHADVMSKLIAQAFHCDRTRVASFMLGNGGSGRNYAFINASGDHHGISHHDSLQSNYDKLKIIDRWEISRLATLLNELKTRTDVDGTPILDNTAIFFSSEISDGDRHNHDNMPVIVAGKLGGAIRTGQHRRVDGQSFGDVFMYIAQQMGVNLSSFGEDGDRALDLSV